MNDTIKKRTLKQYVDSLFSEEGLKSDITITLTHRTLIRTSSYLIGTAFIIILMARAMQKHPIAYE